MKAYASETPVKIFYLNGIKYKLIKAEARESNNSDKKIIIWKVKRIY